ncbi:cohesin domain-containing protein [Wukongibacter baidiensis]|uniref:cohesin domain-containing protein n=1 Tax=Wukongibacter baidiensis TaxID=1723361 RepID=UPI003D7FFB55
MRIRKCGMYFILSVLIVSFACISSVIEVHAAEGITINNTTLNFNNIYYVDGADGDDTSGDGSKANPYETFTKAYNECALTGDAIYLVGKEGVNYNDYIGAISKEISIIGDGLLSKLDFGASQSTWSSSSADIKLYRLNIKARELFRQSGNHKFQFYNCVLELDIALANYNTPVSYPVEFYNSVIDARNTGYGAYRDDSYMENSLIIGNADRFGNYGDSHLVTTQVNDNLIEDQVNYTEDSTAFSYTIDSNYNISGITWEHIGTGTNPDGTQANIGVYGGKFAWSEWETSETLSLDIEAPSYEIPGGTEFETFVVIKEANSIYAEDINIEYDENLFELVSAEPVDSADLKIYHEETSTEGEARYVVASKGEENGLDGDEQILKLTFKAKNVDGSGDIEVSSGLVADGDGNEITPTFGGKTFTITKRNLGDVNKDGEFTLGDLAIAGRLFESSSDDWGSFEPDVDANGDVEDIDLVSIVQSILDNE